MYKNQNGFTLIEMLIVLMIISVLIILIIPNLSEKSKGVYDQGCEALVKVVQTQVESYYLDKGSYPLSLDAMVTEKYITAEQKTCSNNKALVLTSDVVSAP